MMLRDLGNFDYTEDYFKNLSNETKPISGIRAKVYTPFKTDVARNFFYKNLKKDKLNEMLVDFGVVSATTNPFVYLIGALAEKLKEYLAPEDEINHPIQYYFDMLIADESYKFYLNISANDLDYILEVNKKCPICGEHLTEIIDGQRLKNYKIIKIYPYNLSSNEKIAFDSIKKYTGRSDAYENEIAVCRNHAETYERTKDIDIYKELVKAKERAITIQLEERAVENIDIPDTLEKILNHIVKYGLSESKTQLTLNAVKISLKINENDPVYDEVVLYASKHYNYINGLLTTYEKQTNNRSTLLGRKIKEMSNNLMTIGSSPSTVIKTIAQELNNTYGGDSNTYILCKYIVAYFVQHCEVLSHEATE